MITTIPLINLVSSTLNVRKTDVDAEIQALADDIYVHGLKQNLVVVSSDEKPGKYEVVAGGRRLRALQALMHDFRLKPDFEVMVMVEQRESGRETSLSENLYRIAMNPADEYEAFAAIVAEAEGTRSERVHHCAKRFGVTDRHVEQSLRLADLAPEILEALRSDKIGKEAAKAYGAFSDHRMQLTVFAAEEKRTYGTKHSAQNIRDALKAKTYPSNCAQAEYVGLVAYAAAGGRIEGDFFMGADEGEKLIDPAILDGLAREKAAEELLIVVKADGFASGLLTPAFVQYANWPKEPAGFARAWGLQWAQLPKKERAKLIGIYTLKMDGSALDCIGVMKPVVPAAQQAAGHRQETQEERDARRREERIEWRAAMLTVTAIAPPELQQRMQWHDDFITLSPDEDDDNVFWIDVQIQVTRAELEAMHHDAELKLDADMAADIVAAEAEQQPREAAA